MILISRSLCGSLFSPVCVAKTEEAADRWIAQNNQKHVDKYWEQYWGKPEEEEEWREKVKLLIPIPNYSPRKELTFSEQDVEQARTEALQILRSQVRYKRTNLKYVE